MKTKDGKRQKALLKIFIIFLVSLAVISASWFVFIYEFNNHKKNIINAFNNQQYYTNSEICEKVKMSINEYIKSGMTLKNAEKKVKDEILKKETNSENKYIFFYNSDYVIFEKNDKTTEKYKNKSIKQLFLLWKFEGGKNLDNFENLIDKGISGSDIVVKKNDNSSEILSWCFFEVDGKKYVIGMSTSEEYLMRSSLFNQHVTIIYAALGIYTAFVLIILILFSLHLYLSYEKESRLELILKNGNIQKEKFVMEIEKLREISKNARIYDLLTKVYNRSFFYTILSRMNIDVFLPVSIIRADIKNLKNINDRYGSEKGDYVLKKTAEIFLESCTKLGFVSRINDNEFVMVMTNTELNEAFKIVSNIKNNTDKAFKGLLCSIYFGAAVKKYEIDSIFDILELAKPGDKK